MGRPGLRALAGRDRQLAGECPSAPPVDDLDAPLCPPRHKTASASAGEAWIAATVTMKSGWGQEIKPNILGPCRLDHLWLSAQCNPCLVYEWGTKGGRNRESGERLAQSGTGGNHWRYPGTPWAPPRCLRPFLKRTVRRSRPAAQVAGDPATPLMSRRISRESTGTTVARPLRELGGAQSRRSIPRADPAIMQLLPELFKKQTDRFNPPVEVRDVELLVRGVQVIVGQAEAHHHAGNLQHVLEIGDDGN